MDLMGPVMVAMLMVINMVASSAALATLKGVKNQRVCEGASERETADATTSIIHIAPFTGPIWQTEFIKKRHTSVSIPSDFVGAETSHSTCSSLRQRNGVNLIEHK